MIKNLFAFAALLAAAPALADDNRLFQYWVKVPATTQTCSDEAKALGDRLASATNATVIKYECKGEIEARAGGKTYKLYSLSLTYKAKAQLTPYQAVFGRDSVFPGNSKMEGAYASYEECVNKIPEQTRHFETHTSLRPFVALCEEDLRIANENYLLRIEAFGTPKSQLQQFTSTLSSDSNDTLSQAVEDLITRLGGQIVEQAGASFYYYAKSPVAIRSEYFGGSLLAGQCEAQLDEVRSVFTAFESKTVIAACVAVADRSDWAKLEVVRDGYQHIYSDTGIYSVKYSSFESCMNDRARAREEAGYNRSKDREPLGVFCRPSTLDSQIFSAEVFFRKL